MPDRVTKEVRSKIMASIRGRNTAPELKLRKALHALGYRYSLKHRFKEIRSTPDIVMVSRRIVIYVDGCFWHGCPKTYKVPKSNTGYWGPKIQRNIERDKEQNRWLRRNGWKVMRVWEHELCDIEKVIQRIRKLCTQQADA